MALKCFLFGIYPTNIVTDGKTVATTAGAFVYESSTGEIVFSNANDTYVFLSGEGVVLNYGDTLYSLRSRLVEQLRDYGEVNFPDVNLSGLSFVWLDDRGIL